MTNIAASDAVMALIQVVMIDMVLAGDNAVVIGLAAAGLPAKQRKRAIIIGILTATSSNRIRQHSSLPAAFFSSGSAGRCGSSSTRRTIAAMEGVPC